MKVIIAALLSAALIILAPHHQPKLNNSTQPTAKPAAQATVKPEQVKQDTQANAPEPEQRVETIAAKKVKRPAPRKQVANGCERYRSTFEQYRWNVHTALAICEAESGGNVSALSSTGDRGLMQINYVHANKVDYDLSRLYNPYTNIRVAYAVYLSQGWHGWSTYNNGSYLRYL